MSFTTSFLYCNLIGPYKMQVLFHQNTGDKLNADSNSAKCLSTEELDKTYFQKLQNSERARVTTWVLF
jgi:hypothetical protein